MPLIYFVGQIHYPLIFCVVSYVVGMHCKMTYRTKTNKVGKSVETSQRFWANMMNLKFMMSEVTIAKLALVIVFFLHFGSYYGVVAHWEGL